VAPVRLVIDVDAEVYPELHAALSKIESEASRGERLRQLAASGLVWEGLRRAAPAVQPAAVAVPPPVAVPALMPVPVPVAAAVPTPSSANLQAPPAAPPAPPADDFVDLALNAAQPLHRPPPLLVDVIPDRSPATSVKPGMQATPAADTEDERPAPFPPEGDTPPDTHAATRLRLQRMKDRGLFRNG